VTLDDVLHRHVAVRVTGPGGRWVYRSFIVDVTVAETGEVVEVEIDAEVGCLFALSAVTFLDEGVP
jgi:hypothetical protein